VRRNILFGGSCLLFIVFSLVGIHIFNENINKNLDMSITGLFFVFCRNVLIFSIGFCLYIAINNIHRLSFHIAHPVLFIGSLLLFTGSFLLSVFYSDIYLLVGADHRLVNSLLDRDNKIILNVVAGVLLARSVIRKQ